MQGPYLVLDRVVRVLKDLKQKKDGKSLCLFLVSGSPVAIEDLGSGGGGEEECASTGQRESGMRCLGRHERKRKEKGGGQAGCLCLPLGSISCLASPLCSWRLALPLASRWVQLLGGPGRDEGERREMLGVSALPPLHRLAVTPANGHITSLYGHPLQVQVTALGYANSCYQLPLSFPLDPCTTFCWSLYTRCAAL